jgi:hypothetical protein
MQNIAGLWQQTFCFQFNIKPDTKQNYDLFSFGAIGAKIQLSLHYRIWTVTSALSTLPLHKRS